jgi:hypothetical protein
MSDNNAPGEGGAPAEDHPPDVEARLQAHWALQVAAAASSLMVAEDDFSHTTFTWRPSLRALVGEPVPAAGGARAALRFEDLTLLIVEDDEVKEQQGLGGLSLREAFGWLSQQLKKRGAPKDVDPLPHDMPFHGVSQGLLFDVDAAELTKLADWHDFTWPKLLARAEKEQGASAVRCWPHHFDSALLIVLDDGGGDPEQGRSIGVGMSPGDTTYPEPYWYVSPWPYPDNDVTLPLLAARGRWHLSGFTAAVLPRSEHGDAPDKAAEDFLDTAIGACHTLLGR